MIPLDELKLYGPVGICIPSSTVPRFMLFEMSLEGLYVPPYSQLYRVSSSSPAKNRNDAIRMALPEIRHFLFLDDDHWFDAHLLVRMLQKQVPVICALTTLARPPFMPVLFKGEHIAGGRDWHAITEELERLARRYRGRIDGDMSRAELNSDLSKISRQMLGKKKYEPISWAELDGKKGAYPIFAGPGSGILVEREVLDKMGDPWFEIGRYDPEQLQEDVTFYEKCRDLGIPIYCDLDSPMGHMTNIAAWPVPTDDDRLTISLMWENGQKFRLGRSDGAGWPSGKPLGAASPP